MGNFKLRTLMMAQIGIPTKKAKEELKTTRKVPTLHRRVLFGHRAYFKLYSY